MYGSKLRQAPGFWGVFFLLFLGGGGGGGGKAPKKGIKERKNGGGGKKKKRTYLIYYKQKVAPGKINHRNAIKSCQIVLFSSKSTIERLSSSTVVC